jgi:aminoglycoside phosphotransferase (APT) family kinase protein
VIERLRPSTINPEWYDGTIFVDTYAKKSEMLKPALKWMKENEPRDRRDVLCHGDFHPGNILVDDGMVSGVLDWSASRIGEPERDVASTFCNLAIYGPMGVPDFDWKGLAENYIEEYRLLSKLDSEKLNYYKAVNSVGAIEVLELYQLAQKIPLEVKERAISLFYEYSGISL